MTSEYTKKQTVGGMQVEREDNERTCHLLRRQHPSAHPSESTASAL
jgi:hypothetical protein